MNWGWGEIFWMKRADGTQAEHIKTETERQIKGVQAWLEERIEPSGWLTGPEFGLVDAGCGPDRACGLRAAGGQDDFPIQYISLQHSAFWPAEQLHSYSQRS
jgi:glutathione S-transferase